MRDVLEYVRAISYALIPATSMDHIEACDRASRAFRYQEWWSYADRPRTISYETEMGWGWFGYFPPTEGEEEPEEEAVNGRLANGDSEEFPF